LTLQPKSNIPGKKSMLHMQHDGGFFDIFCFDVEFFGFSTPDKKEATSRLWNDLGI